MRYLLNGERYRMPLISSDAKFKFYVNQGLELIFNEK